MSRQVLINVCSMVFIFIVFNEINCFSSKLNKLNAKKGYVNIELKRQKSPLEHYLNNWDSFEQNVYGIFHKKHHHGGDRTNDSIALYRYLDNEFYGEVVIGHPGQKLLVAFDTAWANSFVLSSKCNIWKTVGCWFHNLYDHTLSSEYKKDGRPYIGNEGKYNFTGFYSYDNISISHSNVTAMNFVEMTHVPYNFIFNKIDGVMGLGIKTGNIEPFFYRMLRQKKIKNPMFTIYLNRDKQSNRGGSIALGFINDKHIHKIIVKGKPVSEPINYYPIEPSPFWMINMNRVIVNGTTPDSEPSVLCPSGCKVIVDTSTNSITGPRDQIEVINDAIKAKEFFFNRYTVDCNTVNKLPVIAFEIGQKNFTLKGPAYTVQLSWKGFQVCLSAFVPADLKSEQNFWIFGGAFLTEYYTVYNLYEKTIGIVKSASALN